MFMQFRYSNERLWTKVEYIQDVYGTFMDSQLNSALKHGYKIRVACCMVIEIAH